MVELHFCSQCGISVPQAEVDWAGARTPDGRYLCSEHRAARAANGAGSGGASAGAATATAGAKTGAATGGDVSLLFCANCRVSIPADDEKSGRAVREFGSLLCAACTKADPAERERRRRAVDAEMAADETAQPAFAPERQPESRMPPLPVGTLPVGSVGGGAPYARSGTSTGTWILGILAVVAFGLAGFFGAEFYQRRASATTGPQTPAAAPRGEGTSAEMARQFDDLRRDLDQRDERLLQAQEKALEDLRARLMEDMVVLRSDLAGVRTELTDTDAAIVQRLAKLEGQVLGIMEMMKGLAARGSDSRSGDPPPRTPDPAPPVANQPDPPAPAPGTPAGPPAADPAVTKLVKDLLESKDAGVRFNAALELIRLGNRAAIPPFAKACVSDEHVMVRRVSARGLGSLKAWFGVPVLIQALEDREVYVAQQADFALQQITQQEFGVGLDTTARERKTKAAAAQKWWDKNKDNPPEGVSLEPIGMPGR